MFGFKLTRKPGKTVEDIKREKKQAEDNSRDIMNEWGVEPVRPHIALQLACAQGHLEVVQEFIHENPDSLNRVGWREKTALMYAAANCHVAICQYLINAGAHVNSQDRRGLTPLMRACNMAHEEIILLLLNSGARLNPKDIDGHNAMYYLISARYTKDRSGVKGTCTEDIKLNLIKLLLKAGMPISPEMVTLAHETGQLKLARTLDEYFILSHARNHYPTLTKR